MRFAEMAINIYNSLVNDEQQSKKSRQNFNLSTFVNIIKKSISEKQQADEYRSEIEYLIDEKIKIFDENGMYSSVLKRIKFYEQTIASYYTFIIFWMQHNKINLSIDELNKLSEAVFLGAIGYKLYDVHFDENSVGREAVIFGNYLIQCSHEIVVELFPNVKTMPIIKKYIELYSKVEFAEKQNRWKNTPFNWAQPDKIGLKSAPLFIVYEILFRTANFDEEKIVTRIKGLTFLAAAVQMIDDFVDAEKDLGCGFESLVMSGFFNKNGKDVKIGKALVESYLDEERNKLFYDTTQNLFEKARSIFTECEDDILLLYLEIQNFSFNNSINLI